MRRKEINNERRLQRWAGGEMRVRTGRGSSAIFAAPLARTVSDAAAVAPVAPHYYATSHAHAYIAN